MKTPTGADAGPMSLHVVLLTKKGKSWLIAEARPHAYLPAPPPR